MAKYRYTSNLSLDNLIDLSPEDVIAMDRKTLAETVSRMSQAANKRIQRGMKAEYMNPVIEQASRGGKFSTSGKDLNALRNEYIRAKQFLGNKLSSAKEWQKLQKETHNELKKKFGKNAPKREDMAKLLNLYGKLSNADGEVLTRGERYKYLREMGETLTATDNTNALDLGKELFERLNTDLENTNYWGGAEYDGEFNDGISEFFEDLI